MTLTKELLDEAFFDEFLPKPIDNNQLLLMLKKYLPYKIITADKKPLTISKKSSPTIDPEIISMLKKMTLSHWEKIKNKQKIEHVMMFNELVGKLGEQYDIDLLNIFSQELSSAVKSFNIDAIIRLIGYYPELLKALESKQK